MDMKIPDRIRIAVALAVTASCGAHQVAVGLSGEPVRETPETVVVLPESEPTVETSLYIEELVSTTTYLEVIGTTSTLAPAVTLSTLIQKYFEPEDWGWAVRTTFCESSAHPDDEVSDAVNPSSGASGWFQHLPKFWEERTRKAGVQGADILDPESNVLVAAWLLYETPQEEGHWAESQHCWGERSP